MTLPRLRTVVLVAAALVGVAYLGWRLFGREEE